MIDIRLKRRSEDLDDLIGTTPVIPAKRSRRPSYENPTSVQSFASTNVSDDSFGSVKKRGRPRKLVSSAPSPSDYSPEDYRYVEMRHKNNEASRRSRLSRKDKEIKLYHESTDLERKHAELKTIEAKLQRDCDKWKRAVLRLALKH